MLFDDDASLAIRDSELARLAEFLDSEWLIAQLTSHLGIEQNAVLLDQTYIRYKPATSCLIGYEGSGDGHPLRLYARLHRPSDLAKAKKPLRKSTACSQLGLGGVFLESACVLVMIYPNDHELRVISQLESLDHLMVDLSRELPGLATWKNRTIQAIDCLRYKPERRYVARVQFTDAEDLVLKAHARSFQPGLEPRSTLDRKGPVFSLPRTLGWSSTYRLAAHTWIPGESLAARLPKQPELVAEAGRCLARFHADHLSTSPDISPMAWTPHALTKVVDSTLDIAPSLVSEVNAIAEFVIRHKNLAMLTFGGAHCLIHGDFSADQIVVKDDGLALIDFDRCRVDSPLHDLGTFIARLEFDSLFASSRTAARQEATLIANQLVTGYCSTCRSLPQGCLRLVVVIHLLALVQEPFKLRKPNWLTRMHVVIERILAIINMTHDDFI